MTFDPKVFTTPFSELLKKKKAEEKTTSPPGVFDKYRETPQGVLKAKSPLAAFAETILTNNPIFQEVAAAKGRGQSVWSGILPGFEKAAKSRQQLSPPEIEEVAEARKVSPEEAMKKRQEIFVRKQADLAMGFTGGVPKGGKVRGIPVAPKAKPDLTTQFLNYAEEKLAKDPNATLSKQEIMDFARRPELKKGEADNLNKLLQGETRAKIPAQEFADSIRRDLLELKPNPRRIPLKESSFQGYNIDARQGTKTGKNYEEVVIESPITTNGSPTHYPNSKNYFAHARGDEVVEGGKKIWREQEIQSDLLQKDNLERGFNPEKIDDFFKAKELPENKDLSRQYDIWKESARNKPTLNTLTGRKSMPYTRAGQQQAINKQRKLSEQMLENYRKTDEYKNALKNLEKEKSQVLPFTNDRFGERIMRERIREKASKGYEKYRLPTGETIGKIEGFETQNFFNTTLKQKLTSDNIKIGHEVTDNYGDWIITDILGDGRFKAVPKEKIEKLKLNPEQISKEKIDYEYLKETNNTTSKTFEEYLQNRNIHNQQAVEAFKETFDLTGKSNPQHRRYSDWGKFLKNKFGGKEVTDPQGNTWMEIDLKKEYAKDPVMAYGKAQIGTLLTGAGLSVGTAVALTPGEITIKGSSPPFATSPQERKAVLPQQLGKVPEHVPQNFHGWIREVSKHTSLPIEKVVGLFDAENGKKYDPKLIGIADPRDRGITQLSPSGVAAITGIGGGRNYFKDNYSVDFDINNPEHQILGAGILLNRLRQFDLPAAGIKNPTDDDVFLSYNLGAKGYVKALSGKDKTLKSRLERYRALLIKNGVIKPDA